MYETLLFLKVGESKFDKRHNPLRLEFDNVTCTRTSNNAAVAYTMQYKLTMLAEGATVNYRTEAQQPGHG